MASEEDSTRSLTCNGTPVDELRIADVKKELEDRGLSKAGSKTQLTDRLKAQLLLEKLQQDAAQSSGDEGKVPNIAIKEDKAGQNEFVRQYLQQQQRNLEIQMEAKKQFEDEKKRKSADESSADESLPSETAKTTKAEPDVTSPKKFKDNDSNAQVAPAKEVTRTTRPARKSSRNASKVENGQDVESVKNRSRSTTPEPESIRERTRSGSSSSERSPTVEKSKRGRRNTQRRGRSARGGGRRGAIKTRKNSSSPASSPDQIMAKKKKRQTSISSRSRSRSPQPQVTSPDGATRRSSRKTAAAVRYTPDHSNDADEKKDASPMQRRSSRRKTSDVSVQETVQDIPGKENVDNQPSKGKEPVVKITEDNDSGQKIKTPESCKEEEAKHDEKKDGQIITGGDAVNKVAEKVHIVKERNESSATEAMDTSAAAGKQNQLSSNEETKIEAVKGENSIKIKTIDEKKENDESNPKQPVKVTDGGDAAQEDNVDAMDVDKNTSVDEKVYVDDKKPGRMSRLKTHTGSTSGKSPDNSETASKLNVESKADSANLPFEVFNDKATENKSSQQQLSSGKSVDNDEKQLATENRKRSMSPDEKGTRRRSSSGSSRSRSPPKKRGRSESSKSSRSSSSDTNSGDVSSRHIKIGPAVAVVNKEVEQVNDENDPGTNKTKGQDVMKDDVQPEQTSNADIDDSPVSASLAL